MIKHISALIIIVLLLIGYAIFVYHHVCITMIGLSSKIRFRGLKKKETSAGATFTSNPNEYSAI